MVAEQQHRRLRPLTETARDEVIRKRESGHSLRKIVKWLESERYETPRGKEKWHASQVSAIVKRGQIDKAIRARERMLHTGERVLQLPKMERRLTASLMALESLYSRLERVPKRIDKTMQDRAAARSGLGLDVGERVKARAKEVQSAAVEAEWSVREAEEAAELTAHGDQKAQALARAAASAVVEAEVWVREAEESADGAAYEDQKTRAQAREVESEYRAAELYLEKAIEEVTSLSFKPGRWAGGQAEAGMTIEATGEIKQVAAMAQAAAERAEIAATKIGLVNEKASLAESIVRTARDNVRLAAITAQSARDQVRMAAQVKELTGYSLDVARAKADTVTRQAKLARDRADIAVEQVQFVAALEANHSIITDLVSISHEQMEQLIGTLLSELKQIIADVQKDHVYIADLNKSIGTDDSI